MCTHQSRPGTITLMEPILALASPTCSLWCIPSTGQRGLPTSLCPGLFFLYMAVTCRFVFLIKLFSLTIVSQYCHCPLAGSMVSRFTQWLTSYSCRQPPASRVPSKRSAKNLNRAGWGGIGCVVCPSTWLHSSPIILDSTKTNIQTWRE